MKNKLINLDKDIQDKMLKALQKKLGLYRIDELKGGIYFDKFWLYHKKDEDGNPTYCFGSLR